MKMLYRFLTTVLLFLGLPSDLEGSPENFMNPLGNGNIEIIEDGVCSCDPMSDSLELVAFYNATNGVNWTNTWDLNIPMGTWHGVVLNESGCVEQLNSSYNNLRGSLIDFNLPNLIGFGCKQNELSGSIPNFSNLLNLKDFDCAVNELSGNIPDFNLPNLESFICFQNELSGSIPNFNLPSLHTFDCALNELSGNIPDFNLPNLVYFDCFNNKLSGSIPDFCNTPNLIYLRCDYNELNDISPNFCHNQNLGFFDFSGNQMTFEDIVLSNTGGWYPYQDSVFTKTTYNITEGNSFSIDLLIDETVTDNVYTWYRNSSFYTTIIGSNNLDFVNITQADAGIYTCEITNAEAPYLKLYSREITIEIDDAIGYTVNAPIIITPNGDGVNDYLIIDIIDEAEIASIHVFTRGGSPVYTAEPFENYRWSGTYFNGARLPDADYFYVLKYNFPNDSFRIAKGVLTIRR